MNRFKASLIHFICSTVVLILVFAVVRWIWYPGPLFEAASGVDLIVILVLVDVVLGPLITLVIFNPKKASLKFDMAFVVLCQIGFMFYGVWAIFSARPVYIAFVGNSFYMATANEIDPEDQKKALNPAFASPPLLGPQFVGTQMPTDLKIVRDIAIAAPHGLGLQNLPEYFLTYEEAAPGIRNAGRTVQELAAGAKTAPREELDKLAAYESRKRAEGKTVLFIPLLNKKKILTVAIDGVTGEVLEVL